MGQPTNLFRHSLREGWADLWEWSREHVATTFVSLMTALLGIPAYLRFTGISMTALRDQLTQVAAYSLIGPTVLTAFAYVYFCLRAPSKLYAERTNELRDLRVQLGRSIDDLEEPEPQNRIGQFLERNSLKGALAAIFILLCICAGLVGALRSVIEGNRLYHVLGTIQQTSAGLGIYGMNVLADKAVQICDEQNSTTKRCTEARATAKKIHATSRNVKGWQHAPEHVIGDLHALIDQLHRATAMRRASGWWWPQSSASTESKNRR